MSISVPAFIPPASGRVIAAAKLAKQTSYVAMAGCRTMGPGSMHEESCLGGPRAMQSAMLSAAEVAPEQVRMPEAAMVKAWSGLPGRPAIS